MPFNLIWVPGRDEPIVLPNCDGRNRAGALKTTSKAAVALGEFKGSSYLPEIFQAARMSFGLFACISIRKSGGIRMLFRESSSFLGPPSFGSRGTRAYSRGIVAGMANGAVLGGMLPCEVSLAL